MKETGYTLPVFAVASARAALWHLLNREVGQQVDVDLAVDGALEVAVVPVEQVAAIAPDTALAITRSDPGANLDLTRHTPVWAWVQLGDRRDRSLILEAGEGVGKTAKGLPAIYRFARSLFEKNLLPLIPEDKTLTVRIILPEGVELAKRTSNEAFGILEGLALLGTSGISQPLSAMESLEAFRAALQEKAHTERHLAFCIGSNGWQVAERLSIPATRIVQVGNWLGALLVEAGLRGVASVLLLGYHGKLVKLAGGIFNTSSHIADARLEILGAIAVQIGLELEIVREILTASTVDEACRGLAKAGVADAVMSAVALRVSEKSQAYVRKYADAEMQVGTVLFDRRGVIVGRDTGAIAWIDSPS